VFSKVKSVAFSGIHVSGVDVEVGVLSRGLPRFDIVGLPAQSVSESKLRIKAAFIASRVDFPNKRVTVNLAPADVHKHGSFYDLPIAIGVACSQMRVSIPEDSLFFGELSLDGKVRHTRGVFLLSLFAKDSGYSSVFVPKECVAEATCVPGVTVYGVDSLMEVLDHLSGCHELVGYESSSGVARGDTAVSPQRYIDLSHIIGQGHAKRALEIAAAGGHNMVMRGSPGAGKTMLAKALLGILPPLSEREAFEVTRIYSSVGKIPPQGGLITVRPFRSPHHTVSRASLLGGGVVPSPGEISFAHRGVLFLDELAEFSSHVLESLRQPLEEGYVSMTRRTHRIAFPAKFILVAACNPCSCGYHGHATKSCQCTPRSIQRYQHKLSGPLMDRIDLHVPVVALDTTQLSVSLEGGTHSEVSSVVLGRVQRAREIQLKRFRGALLVTNSEMTNEHIKRHCSVSSGARAVLDSATSRFSLSARAHFKLLRIARTLADLEESQRIEKTHMLEASQFRAAL
jgi:magnesium chelatase family protein